MTEICTDPLMVFLCIFMYEFCLINDGDMYGAFNGIPMYFYIRVLFVPFGAFIFVFAVLYNYLLIVIH